MWRAIKALFVVSLIIDLRNNAVSNMDVSFAEYLEYRRLRRLMNALLQENKQELYALLQKEVPEMENIEREPALAATPISAGEHGKPERPPRSGAMKAGAILLAGALIAAAVVFTGRWEIAAVQGQVYRLDRWSGAIVGCNAPYGRRQLASAFGTAVTYRCDLGRDALLSSHKNDAAPSGLHSMTREEAEKFLGLAPTK